MIPVLAGSLRVSLGGLLTTLVLCGCSLPQAIPGATDPLPSSVLRVGVIEAGDAPIVSVLTLSETGAVCFQVVGRKRHCRNSPREELVQLLASAQESLEKVESKVGGPHDRRVQLELGEVRRIFGVTEIPADVRDLLIQIETIYDLRFPERYPLDLNYVVRKQPQS